MAAAVINGTPCNFGLHTTTGGITITSPVDLSGKLILQSAEYSKGATNERTMDEVGNVVISAWMDPHSKATLEWIPIGTSLAAAITNTTIEAFIPGAFVTITACASMPGLVGTTWEIVGEPKISGTNTSQKRVTVTLEKRAGITAIAT